jgi:metal-sulfur cluster biosynthetic enzyme
MDKSPPTEETVRAALRQVIDPEMGVNIVDLGLVYGIRLEPSTVGIDMTVTSPACPVGEALIEEATEVLLAIAPTGTAVTVQLVWEPPWAPEMMSERVRKALDWDEA